jgi:heptosyltransferase-2
LHQKFYYLDLVTGLGAPIDATLPELRRAAPVDPVPDANLPSTVSFALCPGAEYGPAKCWPLQSFIEVGKSLSERGKIVILGAPGDVPRAAQLAENLPGAINRAGQTTLAEFMSELERSRLVISNDSGAMHLASALGVPTVAIFGSTEPAMTGPLGARTAVLRHHVPCSPCFLRECPLDFACMNSITPAMVLAAAEKLSI